MTLPDGFVFSQTSLQDYMDCQRRFQLRHVLHCQWPGMQSQDALDAEIGIRRGHLFHRLMLQAHSGVPRELLETAASADAEVERWWHHYQEDPPSVSAPVVMVESSLSVPVGRFRLEAKYDLLRGEPGGDWIIIDWKTGGRRPSRPWLARRMQTRVYPYVLSAGGAEINDGVAIPPERVQTLYWFANYPTLPELFDYGPLQYDADARLLRESIDEIHLRDDESFGKDVDRKVCPHCVYRSLCWDEDEPVGELDREAEPRDDDEPDGLDWATVVPQPF